MMMNDYDSDDGDDTISATVPLWHVVECSRVRAEGSQPPAPGGSLDWIILRDPTLPARVHPLLHIRCLHDLKSIIFSIDFSTVFLTSPGPLLVVLGALLGRSWPLLGRSWAALGRSWAAPGRSRPLPEPPKSLQNGCQEALFFRCDVQVTFRSILIPNFDPPN